MPANTSQFDRFMTLGDVAETLRTGMGRRLGLIAALLGVAGGYLWATKNPGLPAFVMIAFGTWAALAIWCSRGRGLPLLPVFVLQTFVAFALPILIGHEVLENYPAEMVTEAGREVLVFTLSLAFVWRTAMEGMRPGSVYSYALQGFNKDDTKRLTRLGFILVGAATAFQFAQVVGLRNLIDSLLPGGSAPIVNALLSAVGMCGFFVLSMVLGSGSLPPSLRSVFWLLLTLNCVLVASGFLLSAAAGTVGAVLVGLLWSTGRMPWRFLVVVVLILGFFNVGKFVMRERYWKMDEGEASVRFTLAQMPAAYAEWSEASWNILTGKTDEETPTTRKKTKDATREGQSIFERVNNLQNLLFVIAAVEEQHIPTVSGASYSVIPALLVPRLFWPDKPRSHEGQIILNVHFGRQDLDSTFRTYVAWGLLAEAYGNFGAFFGALTLGAVLGLFCAWLENAMRYKLVLSLEGFVCFTVFLGIVNSYEMVASVLVTSVFQSIVPISLACLPFVEKQRSDQPHA